MSAARRPADWLLPLRVSASREATLVCLAHAGGAASAFARWPAMLPPWIDVLAVQLPGRGARLNEPSRRQLEPLLDELGPELARRSSGPVALFGHSLGALLAFELARWLRRGGLAAPTRLLLAACRAPQRIDRERRLHQANDDQLLAELRRLGGTPEEVLRQPELMSLTLPALRADLEILERYQLRDEPPLACPLTVFGGEADRIPPDDLEAWRAHTTAPFARLTLPGGHFFLQDESSRRVLLAAIGAALAPSRRRAGAA
jgi:medium-chain acyl-[acyl-carrier-protein] hydrolase